MDTLLQKIRSIEVENLVITYSSLKPNIVVSVYLGTPDRAVALNDISTVNDIYLLGN